MSQGSGLPPRGGHPSRVLIDRVHPEVDGGRFPVKRVVGESVRVRADILCDGHDVLGAVVQHRRRDEAAWSEVPMTHEGNDVWVASFPIETLAPCIYTVEAWLDDYATWRRGLARKVEAGQDVAVDILVGAELLTGAAKRAKGADAKRLRADAALLADAAAALEARIARALDVELLEVASRHADRSQGVRYGRELAVDVDRERAQFSSWYELFPRSASGDGRHGTLRDVIARLPYVAELGFDVLYLPPIHPIGHAHRKGRNNATTAAPDDVGSPWAIGAADGGHDAILGALGTFDDFAALVDAARERGIDVALDLALQCAPDHPWVKEHPAWFRWRPDGTVQYAENPPKKYEDIFPLNFENEDWRGLWEEVRRVVLFWVAKGVRVFRVDNPHTKPFAFWEWLIAEVRRDHPEVFFLSEAFTRPRVMYYLAKSGFAQSYTYFPWRNTREELTDYFTELTQTDVREFFRPNSWPNTPDILTEHLQWGGRPAFISRLVLAATLGASYGIYGPAFELAEGRPRKPGSEEYLDSEKYEIRRWDLERGDSLRHLIARVNRIRREHRALQANEGLLFHEVDNPHLMAYSKATAGLDDVILTVVNLDPHHVHAGFVTLALDDLGLEADGAFQVQDLLTGAHYVWQGARNYVQLDPQSVPAHVFRVRPKLRNEQDFDYFL
jgi:starch synthase (maltosyl-transferring)